MAHLRLIHPVDMKNEQPYLHHLEIWALCIFSGVTISPPSIWKDSKSIIQLQQLPMNISGFKVQRRPTNLRHIPPDLMTRPLRKHIHPSTGPTTGPKLPVNHPLHFLRPLHPRRHLHRRRHKLMVYRRILPIQHPRHRQHHRARARREHTLHLVTLLADELHPPWTHAHEELWHRPADQQVVQLRAVVEGAAGDQLGAAGVLRGGHGVVNVVELDVGAAVGDGLGHAEVADHHGQVGFHAAGDDVEGAGGVGELEGDQQDAELDGGHGW